MDLRTVFEVNRQNLEMDLIWGNEGVGRVRLTSRSMSKPAFMTLRIPLPDAVDVIISCTLHGRKLRHGDELAR